MREFIDEKREDLNILTHTRLQKEFILESEDLNIFDDKPSTVN